MSDEKRDENPEKPEVGPRRPLRVKMPRKDRTSTVSEIYVMGILIDLYTFFF